MGDFIRLQHGLPPWEAGGAHVETYHFYDIPLVGLIEQQGVKYLFRCFVGETEYVNGWSYTLVDDADVHALVSAGSGDEFDEVVGRIARRPGVAAVSIDGIGVVGSLAVSEWEKPGDYIPQLLESANEVLRKVHAGVDEVQRHLLSA